LLRPAAKCQDDREVTDMAAIPESHADLLKKPAFANLATLNADGSPQVTPVWFDFDGTNLRMNTARGRMKDRNLRRDPRIAVSIMDPENPYRYIGIQGRVIEMTENGADAHIDKLAKKYINKDTYPWRAPGEVRVSLKIAIDKVHTNG
jgi:PPOX class probable F420-dependent enzyme